MKLFALSSCQIHLPPLVKMQVIEMKTEVTWDDQNHQWHVIKFGASKYAALIMVEFTSGNGLEGLTC